MKLSLGLLLFGICYGQVNQGVPASYLTVPPSLRYLGDGSGSAIDCSTTISTVQFATTFNISPGNTCTSNVTNHPTVIYATGACTIGGTFNARGLDNGISGVAGDGGGSGGGGGGGAASGVIGTASGFFQGFSFLTGGAIGTAGVAGGAGNVPTLEVQRWIITRAGGLFFGGGAGGTGGSSGPAGGKAGQGLVISCASINFAATGIIDVSGAKGLPSTANSVGSSGGGGAGYVILTARDSLINLGTIYVAGGPGGQCYPTNLVFTPPTTALGATSSGTGMFAHVSGFSGGNPNAATVDAAGSGYNYTPTCTVVTTTGGTGATCTAVMAGVSPNMTLSSVTFAGGNAGYGAANTAYTSCGAGGYGANGWSFVKLMQ